MALFFSSWTLDIVSLIVGLLGIIFFYLTYTLNYWAKKGVPSLPTNLLFGNIKDVVLVKQFVGDRFREIYNEFQGQKFAGLYQFCHPVMMIRDPELIKHVFVKDFVHFENHDFEIDEEVDPLEGKGLFNLKGHRWKNMRIKLTPTFTSGKMKKMFHLILECGEEMKKYLKDHASKKEVMDIKDIMGKYTTDSIGTCAFGIECNSFKNPDSEFRKMGRRLTEFTVLESIRNVILFSMPRLAKFFKMGFTPKVVEDFFRSVVKETMDYREKNHVIRNDFLHLLTELKKKGHVEAENDDDDASAMNNNLTGTGSTEEFTDDDITSQVEGFFFAGFETSATTLSFGLFELAVNPDVQKNLREEIDRVLAKYDGEVTYEGIKEMQYLDKIFYEILRKYPPVTFHGRRCTKSYVIPGTDVTLDEGTSVAIPVYGIHYDPQYYPDPEKFDPERFSEENKKTRPNYTYLPFGEGPRICLGTRFALLQVKIGFISLLTDYEFRVAERTVVPAVMEPSTFIIAAKGGTWLQIVKRDDK